MMELTYDQELLDLTINRNQADLNEYQFSPLTNSSTIKVSLSLPAVNIAHNWQPVKGFDSSLKADWSGAHISSISQSAPVEVFYDYQGHNILTVACSELVTEVKMKPGIHEEDGTLTLEIVVKERSSDTPFRLLINQEYRPYAEVLAQVSAWWEEELALFPVAKDQRFPMYSTWYAFHQNVTDQGLRKELPGIKSLGMNTIIIDDGWQTEDTNRGYAYCGDWQVAPSKFSDFQGFVTEMHQANMKVMVWFSVPFVGRKSQKWSQVADKLLSYDEELAAGVLDIRYQENIDFLVDTYDCFIKDYQIDGLKLDFIDEFYLRDESPVYHKGMAYKTIQEALEVLMTRIKELVLAYSPQFFIEFRQRYIGPVMRQFSNAFRVNDCPYSAINNRIGTVDLRLISGQTPVHSDMLLWHQQDSPENIGLQLAACLFSVIQLSVKLTEQTKAQLNTLNFYTKFVKEHIELLQLSPLNIEGAENLYGTVKVVDEETEIIALYSQQQVVSIEKAHSWLVNGNAQTSLYLETINQVLVKVYNSQGLLQESVELNGGLSLIKQFPGGITEIIKK